MEFKKKRISDDVRNEDGCLPNLQETNTKPTLYASPGRATGIKHHATPLKTRSKTSKNEAGEDVHSSLSPVTPKSRLSRSKNTSPVASSFSNMFYLGVCSQELPDVIWDYNSPKNSTGNNQRLKSLTIGEFLKNMQYSTDQENNNGTPYAELLEKWNLFRTKSPAAPKVPYRYHAKGQKKPPRVIVEEMRKFIKSINESEGSGDAKSDCQAPGSSKENNIKSVNPAAHREFPRQETASSLDEDGNDLDSEDELWGVDAGKDDEVIVKATQDFEACLISRGPLLTHLIPETCRETQYPAATSLNAEEETDIQRRLRACTQVVASKLSSIRNTITEEHEDRVSDITEWDWASDCEDLDWTDDVAVIDTLSQVPDDILQGCSELPVQLPVNKTAASDSCSGDDSARLSEKSVDLNSAFHHTKGASLVKPIVQHDRQESDLSAEVSNTSNYFQSLLDTDSDVFNDASLFDITVEKTVTPSNRPVCTPQEIAMKKEEALKKLKERQRNKQ